MFGFELPRNMRITLKRNTQLFRYNFHQRYTQFAQKNQRNWYVGSCSIDAPIKRMHILLFTHCRFSHFKLGKRIQAIEANLWDKVMRAAVAVLRRAAMCDSLTRRFFIRCEISSHSCSTVVFVGWFSGTWSPNWCVCAVHRWFSIYDTSTTHSTRWTFRAFRAYIT